MVFSVDFGSGAGYAATVPGTGFGLAIVSERFEARGWSSSVGTSENVGARLDVHGVESVWETN